MVARRRSASEVGDPLKDVLLDQRDAWNSYSGLFRKGTRVWSPVRLEKNLGSGWKGSREHGPRSRRQVSTRMDLLNRSESKNFQARSCIYSNHRGIENERYSLCGPIGFNLPSKCTSALQVTDTSRTSRCTEGCGVEHYRQPSSQRPRDSLAHICCDGRLL